MFRKSLGLPSHLQQQRKEEANLLERFATYQHRAGYAQRTVSQHVRTAKHLINWSSRSGVRIADLDEGMIEKFTEHLKRCRCHGFGGSHRQEPQSGACLFLNYARIVGKVTAPVAEKISVVPELLTSFDRWMRQERGTSDATLNNHALYLRVLLSNLGEDPANYDACKLRRFVLDISRHRGWGAAKACTTALRMFIRFLIVDGKCRPGLEAAIPVVAHWRLSSLPRYLKPEEVEQVIAACDPVSPVRKRNRAILLLLARLGLRVGDILKLRMGDIDWKDACIRVSGKSRRQTLLPLTQEVGDAIVSYIREGRPSTDSGFLFIRSCAPFREFANQKAISAVAARAMRCAGIKCPSRGAAHVLRHSIASSMLRNGATLREIADVLRHRSIKTTEIYAKVDVDALGQIAQPWPEVRVC